MRYKAETCVGHGTYGKVYRGLDKNTSKVVALKAIDLEKVPEEIEDLQKEVNMMKQLNLPHVVEYYDSYVNGSVLWIAMEYMDGGSLDSMLRNCARFSEEMCATVLYDLLGGLAYLHKEGKIHRDLKCGNILVSKRGKVKLSDFGVAGQLTQTKQARNTLVGSPYWTAPEVIAENNYNQKADIWSYGVTAIELATGLPPNASMHPMEALMQIPKMAPPQLDSNFSEEFRRLVTDCCQLSPEKRPSAEELLMHPFFEKRIIDDVKREESFTAALDEAAATKGLGDATLDSSTQKLGESFRSQDSVELGGSKSSLGDSVSREDSRRPENSDAVPTTVVNLRELLDTLDTLPAEQIKLVVKPLLHQLSSIHASGKSVGKIWPAVTTLNALGGCNLARLKVDQDQPVDTECLLYTAPEAIFENKSTQKSDIWSIGMLAFTMATGKDPYPAAKNPIVIMNSIRTSPTPQLDEGEFGSDIHTFLQSCTQKNPDDRPTASELLEHDFAKVDAASGTSLLSYELLEAAVHSCFKGLYGDDESLDPEFLDYDGIRKDEKYKELIRTIDFGSGAGLDWDTIEEEMPEVGEYLSSNTFQSMLLRYQKLVEGRDGEENPPDPRIVVEDMSWDF